MAFPPTYAQQPAKGTLMPGQMISVNMYTVQVERFLSQGTMVHRAVLKDVVELNILQVVSRTSISSERQSQFSERCIMSSRE